MFVLTEQNHRLPVNMSIIKNMARTPAPYAMPPIQIQTKFDSGTGGQVFTMQLLIILA